MTHRVKRARGSATTWSRRMMMAGVGLSLAVGAPSPSATAAQTDDTVMEPSEWSFKVWMFDLCILQCIPGFGLCCGEEEIPLL